MVDDNPTNIKIVKYYLAESKCKLLEAKSAMEALSVLSKNKDINVIIIDHKMPDIDGFQLATMIKAQPELKTYTIDNAYFYG
ncbi:MAG: response regulator [Desulfosudis oleivorans]|nr:response regulator [Desulfosudis oleivorans]